MENLYTHIYDITQGEDVNNPLGVAVGPRTTEYGKIIPRGWWQTKTWPGAEYTVIEYDSIDEYKEATAGLEVWYENDEIGQITGPEAWQYITEVESQYRI
jgi:hypothetical protein